MKKLGQHFLKNTAVLDAIAMELDIKHGETLLEIGPGHGELTLPLMRVAKRLGAKIISIEKDHSLIAPLTALGEDEGPGLLSIIEGDALKMLADTVAKLGSRPFKLAGNIPYYITGKLLHVISDLPSKPDRAVLLVQKEVAQRICATPPEMNRLAASVQFWAEPAILAFVSRKDFSPPPDVDSAVIVLSTKKRPQKIDSALYYRAVRGIFAQPRKTLLNNLSAIAANGTTKEEIILSLNALDIDPSARPQDLAISQIIDIANAPLWG